MSTRVVRSMRDFIRHGMGVEVECRCGHTDTLDATAVLRRFEAKGWYLGLNDGFSMGSPYTHFYCSKCWRCGRGKVRPVRIGPGMR